MSEHLIPTESPRSVGSPRHFVLFDGAGNMVDSFASADEAAKVGERHPQRVCVVAYDADGNVVDPRSPASRTTMT